MDRITITRLPDNKGYQAKVESYSGSKENIVATANGPVNALKSLLLELKAVQRRYEDIPIAHLTYEGKKVLELATEAITELNLEVYISNLEVVG